ncbi:24620_t:CDS:2 [Gigaspora rosea]|nr:24620_t:CDS:2 [Gigaspora rosea]
MQQLKLLLNEPNKPTQAQEPILPQTNIIISLRFGKRTPEIYINFAGECMDKDAGKRPDARKICDTLNSWMEDKIFEIDNDAEEKIESSGIIISEV